MDIPIPRKACFNPLTLYEIIEKPIILSNGEADLDEAYENCLWIQNFM